MAIRRLMRVMPGPVALVIGLMLISAQPTVASKCYTHSCVNHKHALEMRHYKRHPMPWCTWGPESSGPPYTIPAFSPRRYRAYNASSGAGGKFQIIPSTWRSIGGTRYAPAAQLAKPVFQERMARKLKRIAGLKGTWVNC